MIKVAITGEMGSGKTHCCGLFSKLGIPVFLTDYSAKSLMAKNEDVKYMLKKMISPDIYLEDGSIDRQLMQVKLFQCPDADKNRGSLNIALYPYVKLDYENFLEVNKTSIYTILESAILYETGLFESFDYIIYVDCPQDTRVERVIKRSNLDEEQQRERSKHWLNSKLKMRASDYIILNSGIYDTTKQVQDIHDKITKIYFDQL